MSFNQTNATAVLLDSNNDSCLLLDKLANDPKVGAKINQYFVNNARALLFTWTLKAGVGIGITTGGGFMVARLESGWSAPCFLKVTAGQAGAIFGFERLETLMAATDHNLVKEVIAGHTAVLGTDLRCSVWPLVGGTSDTLGALREAWNVTDIISVSSGQGICVDASFKGGAITVDAGKNTEAYGEGKTAHDILMGGVKAPEEFVPLYAKLNALSAGEKGGLPA